jgi:hypothetical protein
MVLPHLQDTRRRFREQDKQSGSQEDGNNGATELSNELIPRLGSEKVPSLQIACHIRGLRCRTGCNDTG